MSRSRRRTVRRFITLSVAAILTIPAAVVAADWSSSVTRTAPVIQAEERSR